MASPTGRRLRVPSNIMFKWTAKRGVIAEVDGDVAHDEGGVVVVVVEFTPKSPGFAKDRGRMGEGRPEGRVGSPRVETQKRARGGRLRLAALTSIAGTRERG